MTFRRDALHGSSGRFLVLVSAIAVVIFVAWGYWAEIDQITRANGQVIASSRNQVIQSPDGGVIQEIHVREGDRVKHGEILISFDKAKAEASYLEVRAKVASLQAALARLSAEMMGGTPRFPAELADYPDIRASHEALFRKRQGALAEEISSLKKMLDIATDELEINRPLLVTGDVSRADILRLQRQVAELEGQITNRRNRYFQDAQSELSKVQEELDVTLQVLEQRKDLLNHAVITSPMDGVVRNVRITTRGGVARPGEEIMQIVPADDELIIEAKVSPADIGFIKPGLPASIKLDAYDYTIYGIMKGNVTYISADTLSNEESRNPNDKPFYRVQVEAKGKGFNGRASERIEIQPGMTATVEIKTSSNSVLRYLTKPIVKTMSESLGER